MSLALISATYNFESGSEHGGDDSEDFDADAEHETEKKESDMAIVDPPSECGIEGLVNVIELNHVNKNTENELEVPTVPSCPQSKQNRKRQKRVGNWMWSYKRRRSGRPKSKPRGNVAIHDQPCESKDVLQIDPMIITGGGSSELKAHHHTDRISIINNIGPIACTDIPKIKIAEDHPTLHTGKVAKLERFKCHKCSTTFANKGSLGKHIMRLHSKVGRPFKCSHNQCGCSFATATHLQRHETLRHGIIHSSGKECMICNQSFRYPCELKDHMKSHKEADNRSWKCKLCPSFFSKLASLKLHENRVHGRKAGRTKIPCEVCGMTFYRARLIRHMTTHTETSRPVKCTQCPSYFLNLMGLRCHENKVHNRTPGASFSCDVCDKVVNSRYELARHMKHAHGKEVDLAFALKSRRKISPSAKPGNNDDKHGPRNLAVEDILANGIIKGEKLKLHGCTHCERSFPFLSWLKRHMRSHADIKPFSYVDRGPKFGSNSRANIRLRPCKLFLTRCDDLLLKYRKEETSSKYKKNGGGPSRKLVGRNSKLKKAKKSDSGKALDNETERGSNYPTQSQMEAGHTTTNLTMPQIACKLITQRKKRMRGVMKTGDLALQLESQVCANSGNGKSISPGDAESSIDADNITGHIPTPLIFNCPYCLESFEDAGLLIGHLPIHEEENTSRERIAESCEDQANSKLGTTDDQKIMSANDTQTVPETMPEAEPELIKMKESKELLCPECEISFPSDRALRFHMRVHSEPVRKVKCRQCNVSFTTFKGLQIHDGRLHKVSKHGILSTTPSQEHQSSSSSPTVAVKFDENVSGMANV